jgi:uncharacterized membrane protein
MDAALHERGACARRFVINHNRSLSWRGHCLFLALIALLLGIITAGFVLAGLWLVAPFAFLELVVVGAVLTCFHRRAQTTELIEISPPEVTVSVGRDRAERRYVLPHAEARVVLNPAAVRGHPSRLFICSADRGVEVGRCLGDDERRQLARELQNLIPSPTGWG